VSLLSGTFDGRALPSWAITRDAVPRMRRTRRVVLALFMIALTLYVMATVARIYFRKYYVFLPDYISWSFTPAPAVGDRPTHLFFLFVDHFEPDGDAARVRNWARRYGDLAGRHRDSVGRAPQHTFFYPIEQNDPAVISALRDMAAAGYGEVELHFHHDYDTESMLRRKLVGAIRDVQRHGFFQSVDGATHFAFIHGNSGLDNSNGPLMCGVNAELRLLRELGCFADYTFPSVFEDSQPPFVNTIYAARDDDQPKSYRRSLPISAVKNGAADLVIFQGPLVFAASLRATRLFVDLDDGDIHPPQPATPHRVDRWVRANIHVPERPDWVFVKVFAHGVSSSEEEEVVVGPTFDQTLTYLEQRYNDGRRYVLHYITAREAYNLVRAASDGVGGEPQEYLNYVIPPYRAGQPALATKPVPNERSTP
jgi:hypothetical protein